MKRAAVFLLVAGVLGGVGTWSQGQTKDAQAGAAKGAMIKSTMEKEQVQVPNFATAYGLPLPSIETLGNRLVEARKAMNPLALALVAVEIGVDENVSGKKAEISAEDVHKEAVDLAKMRFIAPELKAVALLSKEPSTAKELADLAQEAGREEAKRIEAFKANEKDLGIRYLKVSNHADHHVDVYENGNFVGRVSGHTHQTFHLPHLQGRERVHLFARNHRGEVWRAHVIVGNYNEYHWTLLP